MSIGVYIRVSTTGQNEAGQRAEIERWLTAHGMNDVRWFVDKATGDNLNRPGFEALQAAIFAGEISAVVVYKLDRLSRSMSDGINTLAEWINKGLRVVSVTQQLDFSGAVGRMVAAVLFGVAEMEQETRRERQAAGIAVAKRRGKYKGRKAGATKIDPARIIELRGRGMKDIEIAKVLGVSRQTIWRLGA